MPWYEPCANSGYTKFYSNPQLREDRFVVSDDYIQALLRAYRQGYVNAGGPDYEDSDDRLLDHLAANCVGGTSDAAGLGANDAAADIAAGQTFHTQSLAPGGAIPTTPATGAPTAASETAVVYTTDPQGQPLAPIASLPGGIQPTNATSGPGSAFGFGTTGGFVPVSSAAMAAQPRSGINWILIAAVAAAAWFLLKK